MKQTAILFLAVACCVVGCDGDGGGSQCTVLAEGGSLTQLDPSPPQISIEVRITEVTQNFSQSLGVDWDLVTSIDADNGGTLGGYNGDFRDEIARSGATGGETNRLYMIPGNHDPNSYFGVVWQDFIREFAETSVFVAAPPFVCFFVDANSLVPLSGFPGIDLSNLAARDPGLTGGTIHTELLDDAGLTAMIQAIEADQANQILAVPNITTYSGQRAVITVQDFTPPVSRYTSEFQNAITDIVANPISTFSGLTLEVTPTVTENDRVILELRTGSLGASAFLSVPFDVGGLQADLEFPIVQTSRAFTNIEVADGETAFIGGLTRPGQSQMEAGLPFLKDLPLIGQLFGDGSIFDDPAAELLILVTPRIIQPN